jgi:hypothetical protein
MTTPPGDAFVAKSLERLNTPPPIAPETIIATKAARPIPFLFSASISILSMILTVKTV